MSSNLHLDHQIQVLSGQRAHVCTRSYVMNVTAQNPVASQASHLAHHTGSEFQQLFFGLLDPLWVSFNSDQVALLIVRWNAYRHLVEVLNPVNFKARMVVTQPARPRLATRHLDYQCLEAVSKVNF